jgi:Cu-Zn family superoxide dismutase
MRKLLTALISALALTVAVSQVQGDHHEQAAGTDQVRLAVADLQAAPGQSVSGTVTFMKYGNSVTVVADIRGLPPNSTHGFHVHENGVCQAPDFASAGGHFNPGGHPHAGPPTTPRHAGDLGNVEAGPNGRVYRRMIVTNLSLGSGPDNVIGKAVVVHANRDDLTSQPSGDAGGRIACGVVRAVSYGQQADRK